MKQKITTQCSKCGYVIIFDNNRTNADFEIPFYGIKCLGCNREFTHFIQCVHVINDKGIDN